MKFNTVSQVISFARKLEEDGAGFYESAAKQYAKDSEVLRGFVNENKKNITRVERAYYSAITDALEGGFAFDLDPDEYTFNPDVSMNKTYSDAIETAIRMEEKTARFYDKAAQQAKPLMADVPRAFSIMARLRDDRRQKLTALLDTRNPTK
ncbi:MAG: ferritin-like domain-containing protein [Dehalococcoidales bacterium]|jgi:rubrerythrin